MSNWGAMQLTDTGRKLAAEIVSDSDTLVFSKFAFGSGSPADDTDISKLDELIDIKQDIGISTIKENDGQVVLHAVITNLGILEPYAVKEMGLYLLNPYTGDNVLYGYFQDSLPDTMPSESIRAIEEEIEITLNVSGSSNVTAKIAFDNLATIQDIEDRIIKMSDVYPVGAVYIGTTPTNPAELFTGTVWEELPAGRMLIGQGDFDTDTNYKAGELGGEMKHKLSVQELPSHTHQMEQAGNHKHVAPYAENSGNPFGDYDGRNVHKGSGDTDYDNPLAYTSEAGKHNHKIGNTGSGIAHNNMPPYLVVYMWQRVS